MSAFSRIVWLCELESLCMRWHTLHVKQVGHRGDYRLSEPEMDDEFRIITSSRRFKRAC